MADGARDANLEILSLAWSLGWRIAAGLLAGYYLDGWIGSTPLFTLLLSLAALAIGVRQILVVLNTSAGERDDEPRRPGDA